jgi:hypothetical protein
MLRPGHIRLPKDEAAEAKRAAGFARKQRWKELPGNSQANQTLGQTPLFTATDMRVRFPSPAPLPCKDLRKSASKVQVKWRSVEHFRSFPGRHAAQAFPPTVAPPGEMGTNLHHFLFVDPRFLSDLEIRKKSLRWLSEGSDRQAASGRPWLRQGSAKGC